MKIQNILNFWALKLQKKKKHYQPCTGFLKYMRIQLVHVSSLHLKHVLQNKFLNLFPMSFSLYTAKLSIFLKNAKFFQNSNKFRVSPHHSFYHYDLLIQSLNNINKKGVPDLLQHMTFLNYIQSYPMVN